MAWDCCLTRAGTLGTEAVGTRGVGVTGGCKALAATPGVFMLYVWKKVVFKLHLTPSFSAAGEGGGEGGGQSKAASGRLINSGCEERGCGAPG